MRTWGVRPDKSALYDLSRKELIDYFNNINIRYTDLWWLKWGDSIPPGRVTSRKKLLLDIADIYAYDGDKAKAAAHHLMSGAVFNKAEFFARKRGPYIHDTDAIEENYCG